jgi:hypothetical protein
MLIKLNDDGSISDEVLGVVDWQNVFVGNPTFDIARFVSNCVDAPLRRQIERDLIDFYHDQLSKKLREHGKSPRFTKEQAHKLYEYALVQEAGVFSVVFSVTAIPIMNSEAEQENVKKLTDRLDSLFDDILPLMDKYRMHEQFKLKQ